MAESAARRSVVAVPRHFAFVRVTHWITTLSFSGLLVSGVEILISHPRFYWGEAGNVNTPALFQLPIPASRGTVPTGYGYVLPDQNGWSRYLHFQAAWAAVLTGLVYAALGSAAEGGRRRIVQLPTASRIPAGDFRSVPDGHLDGARDVARGCRRSPFWALCWSM